ncbi:MAG TPA: hypothetical protein VF575_04475 [Candidatus Saccharimonadales bacterium]|jgi:hypothetical protein
MIEFDAISAICGDLFGVNNVEKTNIDSPQSVELTINTSFIENSPVPKVWIGMYGDGISKAFMHFDDFDFEYDEINKNTIEDITKYLAAIKEGKLFIKSKRLFGLQFNKKIVLKP